MSLQDELVEKIQCLPRQQQMIVRALLDQLAPVEETKQTAAGTSWLGCLEHLGTSISAEDIDEARRERWGNFPRSVRP